MSTITGTSTEQLPVHHAKLPYPSVLCQPMSANALWSTHSTNAVNDATSKLGTDPYASARVYATASIVTSAPTLPASSSSQGTVDNPLIPKRRRRTSPEELAVLERFFTDCPLPTQAQRAQLASKVGMTGRALQVWFQNRRQKEKKEANQYHPDSSAASSTGSATDPDQDAADLEGLPFAFSSSPVPVQTQPLQHVESSKPAAPAFNAPSNSLYSGLPVNKENLARIAPILETTKVAAQASLPSPPISAGPTPKAASSTSTYTYTYSYPPSTVNHIPVYETDLLKGQGHPRPAPVAAKKHVRKRPLGSHAPLARKPSLPHAFNFPDSPPHKRSERLSTARPPLRRAASAASACSATSNGGTANEARSLSGSFLTQSMTGNGDVNRARVWLDALGDVQPLPSPVDSPVEVDQADQSLVQGVTSADAASEAPMSAVPDVTVTAAPSSGARRGFMTKDEVWQHMASDAPSSPAASTPALTRRAMLAHTANSEAQSALDSAAYRRTIARLQHQQSDLYGSASVSSAATLMSAALEGSRAGGEAACALSALERKRARLVGHGEEYGVATLGRATPSVRSHANAIAPAKHSTAHSTGPSAPKRRKSANGTKAAPVHKKSSSVAAAPAVKARSGATSKPISKAKAQSQVQSAQDIVESLPRSYASSVVDDSCSSSSLSSMGDLSFSSTSTTVSTLVGTPSDGPAPFGSYLPKVHARASSDVRDQKAATTSTDEDDERECAELLLGLGGFF